VKQLQNKKGATTQSSYTYTYYLDGNQRTKTDHTGRVSTYTYDGLGRLTNEAESGSGVTGLMTYAYTYDTRSNRATLTASGAQSYTTAYDYDVNDRLLQTVKTTGQTQEITNYQYDANGNTLSALTETLTPTGGTASLALGSDGGYELYTYDGFNQLISTIQDGVETTYVYKPDGLRYNKATGGTTTTHIWDGANIVAELTGSSVTATYVRGINLIAKGGGSQYYSFNAHGDVVQLTNSSGTVTKDYRYDAFGVEVGPEGTDTNPWRYCGEYFDLETGTVYLRARYYDPVVGRFLTEDNIRARQMNIFDPYRDYQGSSLVGGIFRDKEKNKFVVNDPLSLNLYTYTQNNPIMFQDPSGHFVLTAIIVGAIIGVVVAGGINIYGQIKNGAKFSEINWKSVGVSMMFGAVSGAVAGTPIGLLGQAGINAFLGGVESALQDIVYDRNIDWAKVGVDAGIGGLSGLLGGKGATAPTKTTFGRIVGAGSKDMFSVVYITYSSRVTAEAAVKSLIKGGVYGTATQIFVVDNVVKIIYSDK
jgi:RHS repeat-associated protein